ncbi:MAG: type II toxin-antitoxin system RelE/ParE family toxin [Candidatus Omnitrophica bacterium]|nr:type II toxin-antitoxin system RelE/ParE family toxin [Candidatus Omnitrophota bacterium]
MISYDFTKQAEKEFLKLPKDIQRRIIKKIESYLKQPNPLRFAKRLTGTVEPCFRFQIGDYRVIFDWEKDKILIIKVGHRREIYR